ncbi:branched-chain amino acid ABC transporter permease [Candidatus Peregrinibacteria bacterium]|jgi:ABC-type branched-subunit amino acid transport system permease subunit|nr:branched-chain amino acid ABC transporter permease [Candidatus Peregrinibacteria bacterium]MBT3598851.1 branched-chain amino acid ABC transporter permease [Candidatus Peregrinibacteria bacterium]MBT4585759.1 branched-chain amino acid ABC transporter permease [Candidatus Peregrinibacteria bacterium]MBT6730811.1 branched-chain amino acid ABC transporter permease [Candidatus Peregrinibacteria bacterium]MBT7009053.1 branched-chain amino acid ABC transporter permease [Candidatus Peregrinibacteria
MIQFLLHVLVISSVTSCVTLGYNFVFGKGKILHFGQLVQTMVAAYGLWVPITQYGQPFFVGLCISISLLLIVTLLLSWLSMRLEPDGYGVLSIALHLIIIAIVLNWNSVTRGALGIPKIPRGILPSTTFGYAIVCVAVLAAWVFFLWRVDKGSFSRNLSALSENEWHAQSLGVSRARVHAIAFSIASGGSLISSILFSPYQGLLTPSDFHFPQMIFYVMCVVAGGPGKLWGVLGATTALVFLREGIRFVSISPSYIGPVQLLLFGAILFISVWIRRDTVFPKERKI